MKEFYKGRRILITGAAGTVGRGMARELAMYEPLELRLMDNNETGVFFLMEQFRGDNANCFLGDVRDRDKVHQLSEGIDVIIHAAAYKHVILSEYNPFDVVQTNIIGVENIIKAANACGVKHVLFTSSDKAVNPTNVMGASKLMGEKLITAATAVRDPGGTVFASSRFGNVMGSRGSVVPLFKQQILRGGPVTVTDKRMTRFIMTVEEAARLVLRSLAIARGGEVFVTKMPVARIPDLAEAMIEMLAPRHGLDPSGIRIEMIGSKPGEKLYEELMSEEEVHRSLELTDMFVITPAFASIYRSIRYEYDGLVPERPGKSYVSESEKPLSKEELKSYLEENGVLDRVEEHY